MTRTGARVAFVTLAVLALAGTRPARAECGAAPLDAMRAHLLKVPPATPANTYGFDFYRERSRLDDLGDIYVSSGQNCADDTPEQVQDQDARRLLYRQWIDALKLEAVPVMVDAATSGQVSKKVKVTAACGPAYLAVGRSRLAVEWEDGFNQEFLSFGIMSTQERQQTIHSATKLADYPTVEALYRKLAAAMNLELKPLTGNQSAWLDELDKKGRGAVKRLSNDDNYKCNFDKWAGLPLPPGY